MIVVESVFGSLMLWGGEGSVNLKAIPTDDMLNGRNLKVLCVPGYVCLRGPAGTYFLNAVNSIFLQVLRFIELST